MVKRLKKTFGFPALACTSDIMYVYISFKPYDCPVVVAHQTMSANPWAYESRVELAYSNHLHFPPNAHIYPIGL